VEGPCEHGNEPSGSINAQVAASDEGLSFMELVLFWGYFKTISVL
jgi:hypothetical protein